MKSTTFRLGLILLCATASLFILQGQFDRSDHGKAERAVRGYTGPNPRGESLGNRLERASRTGAWTSEITHGCRGIVRVTFHTGSALYEFDYDVPAHTIHPGNELGRQVLASLDGPAPADGGAPHD